MSVTSIGGRGKTAPWPYGTKVIWICPMTREREGVAVGGRGVAVAAWVAAAVGEGVNVVVGTGEAVAVGVFVGVAVGGTGVAVGAGVFVGVSVGGTGVAVAASEMGLAVGVGASVSPAGAGLHADTAMIMQKSRARSGGRRSAAAEPSRCCI